ncbi:type I-E CRISPR-associated protein Cse1/CasA [Lacticaseibacillus pabuli]|uniref:Type I-E CRISPR-associated protein Cse1/CasA n=1 Tax=Lacticaseibacillus pabuli TaxID=3025672 RepID=A0ABY7WW03_9LACO|nr:type I-E CRISPR-associated protein Cse1/CasA [Lacticaseibacillus sp. KACC 23028]WDF83244.1 type I-E CRISPR-associated protein Cse1/CasA [Lacticaseibacillus sp. KACC 23028]
MVNQHFNLVTEPWIKVIVATSGETSTVSLKELFANAQNYRQLAGDMRAQDFAVMRLLLAILHTVYSRYDAAGNAYDWLKLDDTTMQVTDDYSEDEEFNEDLLTTWSNVFEAGKFSEIVQRYLATYEDAFDLFGDRPFYQVTSEEYDNVVPAKKRVATGTGTVAIKQINRLISESANTPDIFTPKTNDYKNEIGNDELTRWLIMYQNFTGVTDKTKVVTDDKYSTPAGWAYRLNPVYVQGKSVFETLMLNLVMVNQYSDSETYAVQHPVWETTSNLAYIDNRKKMNKPDNLAELYTTWSRVLHIEWNEDDSPIIFSAGLPIFDTTESFIEPMTTWRWNKKDKEYKPAMKGTRSLGRAMWRNFGEYVNVYHEDDYHEPGVVSWTRFLKERDKIDDDKQLTLASVALISDGNATSQSPVAEVVDDMSVNADVLFDDKGSQRWPTRIEDVIDKSQQIGKDYWSYVSTIARIRNLSSSDFASRESGKFYEHLNEPFREWLGSLTNQDNRDDKVNEWKQQLQQIVLQCAEQFRQLTTPRDIKGIINDKGEQENAFTAFNWLKRNVNKDLK